MNETARVGKQGSEYLNPHKYIPEDISDLVAGKILLSTKKTSLFKHAAETKTVALLKENTGFGLPLGLKRMATSAPPATFTRSFDKLAQRQITF